MSGVGAADASPASAEITKMKANKVFRAGMSISFVFGDNRWERRKAGEVGGVLSELMNPQMTREGLAFIPFRLLCSTQGVLLAGSQVFS